MTRHVLRWLLVLPLVCSGCGFGKGGGAATPSADLAGGALEKSLAAWNVGKRPGTLEGTDPPVQAVDSKWQSGAKLGSFEILHEEASETERRFSVRLVQGNPPITEEVRYMVVGKGPILVYREEDYQRMINMDNNPVPRPSRRAGR
jgi:hypothetical protein